VLAGLISQRTRVQIPPLPPSQRDSPPHGLRLMDNVESAKQRVISAALRVAAAERGGLDQVNADAELQSAHQLLDDALRSYGELSASL
jgi:hypothetical protein